MRTTNLEEVVEQLRPLLPNYLSEKGIDVSKNFKCISPDHNDSTPSMSCKNIKESAHCFACGITCDIFSACALLDNKPSSGPEWIQENVLYLAKLFNLDVQLAPPTTEDIRRATVKRLLNTIQDLVCNPKSSASDKNELFQKELKRRKWFPEGAQEQRIGSIEQGRLKTKLLELGFEEKLLLDLGILNNHLFGENRITFCLLDKTGSTVYFTSRSLDGSQPKYCNLPITDQLKCILRSDRDYLYGEYELYQTRSNHAFLVEGQPDRLSMAFQNLHETVAIGGLGLRERQLATLQQMGITQITVILDGDEQGQKRLKELVQPQAKGLWGFETKIISLEGTGSKDPDEYLRTHTAKELLELPRTSLLTLAYTSLLESKGQKEAVLDICKGISHRESPIERSLMIQELSKLSGLDNKTLNDEVNRLVDIQEENKEEKTKNLLANTIALLKSSPQSANTILEETLIRLEDITTPTTKESHAVSFLKFLDYRKNHEDKKSGLFEGYRLNPHGLGGLEGVLNGNWKEEKFLAIGGKENVGKCISEDSLVLTKEFGYVKIKDLVNQNILPTIYATSKNSKVIEAKVSHFYNDDIKPVAKVTTFLGTYLETTASHKWLTLNGWKSQDSLTTEDYVATPLDIGNREEYQIEDDKIRLMAYLICEGVLTKGVGISNTNKEIIEDFQTSITKYFGDKNLHFDTTSYPNIIMARWKHGGNHKELGGFSIAKTWLQELGIWNHLAKHKNLPSCVWQFSNRQKIILLGAMLDCDGWYALSKVEKLLSIGYCSASEELCYGVHLLLLSLGIPNRFRYKATKLGEKVFDAWITEIGSGLYGKKLLEDLHLPSLCKREAQDKILNWFNSTREGSHRKLQGCYRTKVKGDLLFVKVKSISEYINKQVYDLTVPGLENFSANGLVVHNTAFVTQCGWEVLSNPANEAMVIHFSIDDSASEVLPRYVCQAYGKPDLEMNHVSNPKFYIAEDPDLISKRDLGYRNLRELVLEERLVLRDASAGCNIDTMSSMIKEAKERHPNRYILVILDNLHKLDDFAHLDLRTRYKNISERVKRLCTHQHVSVLSTVEYTKLEKGKVPSNNNISETVALLYDSNYIQHMYNELHEFGAEDASVFHNDPVKGVLPRVTGIIGKNKICSFKGNIYLDLYPASGMFKWVDPELAVEEKENFIAQKGGKSSKKNNFFPSSTEFEYAD